MRSRFALPHLLALFAVVDAAGAEPTPGAIAEARRHFERGLRDFNNQLYAAAVVEYEAAYRLAPLPGFLYNLGQAQRLRGEPCLAVDAYRRYLAAEPAGQVADLARDHLAGLDAARCDAPRSMPPAASAALASPPAAPSPVIKAVPVYEKWWLWTTVAGVVVAGAGVGVGVGLRFGTAADTSDGSYTATWMRSPP